MERTSAKSIYSQIFLKGGGACLRDAAKLAKSWGVLYEKYLSSYKSDGTTDETFMEDKTWLNDEMAKLAKILQVKDYYSTSGLSIDYFARAIKDGHGMFFGVTGTNNGTWSSAYPVPPTGNEPNSKLWGHCIFGGKFKKINGKKYIGILNSWGDEIGEKGWQWLSEDWFPYTGRWTQSAWVFLDKENIINNNDMILKKEKNSNDIYYINEVDKIKINIADMVTLNSFGSDVSYEEVESLSEYTDKGSLLFVERKIN